jgi:hypothetical protein
VTLIGGQRHSPGDAIFVLTTWSASGCNAAHLSASASDSKPPTISPSGRTAANSALCLDAAAVCEDDSEGVAWNDDGVRVVAAERQRCQVGLQGSAGLGFLCEREQ